MSDLDEFRRRINAFCEVRDWKQFHDVKDVAIALNLEATEVLEHFVWKTREETQEYLNTHKAEVGEELADTLYWIILMANDLGIDLKQAFNAKMDKNEKKYAVEKAKGNHKKYTELEKE